MEEFEERGKAEQRWLREVCEAVESSRLHTLVPELKVEQLVQEVVRSVRECTGDTQLPLTYSLLSVSELIARQKSSCFSSLTWSTNQHRERVREAELAAPNHRALPRARLLLIGRLCDGRSAGQCDGHWRVMDAAAASLHCELLNSSPDWIGNLMLFPSWNYITHNAPGPGQEVGGYLELIDPPVCVTSENPRAAVDPGSGLSEFVGVREAAKVLKQRGGVCVSVCGEVSAVCPLLLIGGKSFFCFILAEDSTSVPVLVTEAECVFWRHCLRVGRRVCVSALRVCSLRGWTGHRVLSVTSQSRLRTTDDPKEPGNTLSETQTQEDCDWPSGTDTLLTHSPTSHTAPQGGEEDEECVPAQLRCGPSGCVKWKCSKVISYKGRISRVLNAEAGLYEIDGKVGLCLAYQPLRKWGGGLRPGAELELHHVHFLWCVSSQAPGVVLSVCLRSSVQVMCFSPLASEVLTPESDTALLRYLLERNLGVSHFIWFSHCCSSLRHRLCPRWVCEARVCVVAGRLLQFLLGDEEKTREKRDIYREMLHNTHTCPLTQYRVGSPGVTLWSVGELRDWMERECWACLSLRSLLPPGSAHLTRAQLNPTLCWSAHTHTLPSHTLLLGVLELSAGDGGCVRLRDQTGALQCVCVHRDEDAPSSAPNSAPSSAPSSAWIGCLVCVQQCTLVMERFMSTDFPSWRHLDQHQYITHKHCRVYLQVCVEDLHIISPSASMSALLGKGGEAEREGGGAKRTRDSAPCVSLLFRLDSKQGPAYRNAHAHTRLTLGFNATVTRLGHAQLWDTDPKNTCVEERETVGTATTMELQFVGSSVCWFPVLQPGAVFRLIALNTQDVSVLSGSGVPVRGGVTLLSSPSLLIQPQWRIHTVTLMLPVDQPEIEKVMSVSEVLHSSCASNIVSFRGVISERITVQEHKARTPSVQSLMDAKDGTVEHNLRIRLTLQDSDAPRHSLQVYLDLSQCPYIPGLIAGATLLLLHFQRKVSVVRNVYCSSLPISCVTVSSFGRVKPVHPLPIMHLGERAAGWAQQGLVGRLRGHVVCVVFLRLQWVCSLCGSVFKQTSCTRSSPHCDSTSAVFQAEAKVAVEDGTGEAQVWFSTETVSKLLMLSVAEWEGLQRHLKVRGHLRVYTRGRTVVCDVDSDDVLVQYLCCLCSSSAVCRQLTLTCKLRSHKPEKAQLRNMSRGEQEFISKFPQPLQLHCTEIHTQ